jgi:hypothetical protein
MPADLAPIRKRLSIVEGAANGPSTKRRQPSDIPPIPKIFFGRRRRRHGLT